MRVLKWSLAVDDRTYFIGEGTVVYVNCQVPGQMQVWTVEENSEPSQSRRALVVETGEVWPEGWVYLGSAIPRPDLVGAVAPRALGDSTVVYHVVGEPQ